MHAGVAVSTGSVEGRAVLVDETLLLVRQVKDQVGEPGAGRGLQAEVLTLLLSSKSRRLINFSCNPLQIFSADFIPVIKSVLKIIL